MYQFLPIGSVIKISNKNMKFVIIGRYVKQNRKFFDYKCVPYPYGFYFQNDVLNINNSDIEKVYFLGNINYKE